MIDFYFWPTPNAYKVAVMLAEIGISYRVMPINILEGEQHAPEFLDINPNGKVPAIVDPDGPDGKPIAIFESGAILLYLAEKTGKLLPTDSVRRYEALQWLMFQMGGFGPMLGQAHHFRVYAPEQIDYAVERYTREATRLYKVLDRRLAEVAFLAGEYSIADIATFTWVRTRKMHGQDLQDYPAVRDWYNRIKVRPSVSEALSLLKSDMTWKVDKKSDSWTNMFGAKV
jgi:GSH-dependent disulfide-bond oxidoreductase|tara:strand:+ start:12054 stop:12737 length:684 start_codon:yes stop_codon:yes gene_type:complete